MNKTSASLIETSPLRFLLILVPFVIAALTGVCTMGATDTAYCLWWVAVLMLIGFVTLPLAAKLWENFSSGGFFLSGSLCIWRRRMLWLSMRGSLSVIRRWRLRGWRSEGMAG